MSEHNELNFTDKRTEDTYRQNVVELFETDPTKQDDLKEAANTMLASRLEHLRIQQSRASDNRPSLTATLRQKDRPPSTFDYDKDIADCESAIDVLNGRRNKLDPLKRILNSEADQIAKQEIQTHKDILDIIPNHGFLGLKGKNPNLQRNEYDRHANRLRQIGQVVDNTIKLAQDQ